MLQIKTAFEKEGGSVNIVGPTQIAYGAIRLNQWYFRVASVPGDVSSSSACVYYFSGTEREWGLKYQQSIELGDRFSRKEQVIVRGKDWLLYFPYRIGAGGRPFIDADFVRSVLEKIKIRESKILSFPLRETQFLFSLNRRLHNRYTSASRGDPLIEIYLLLVAIGWLLCYLLALIIGFTHYYLLIVWPLVVFVVIAIFANYFLVSKGKIGGKILAE